MKTHVPKIANCINQIEFPALKILYFNWVHIHSLEFLGWIHAPVLSQLSLIDCENFMSSKPVVKMKAEFMR
jgi:hypothetical protein